MIDDHKKLLEALLSEQNPTSPLAGQGHEFDENDLAAYATSGRMPQGREDLFQAALFAHPALRAGIAFEREHVRRPGRRFLRLAAAASVVLAIGWGAFALSRVTPTPLQLLQQGRFAEAVAALEDAPAEGPASMLLVAARHALAASAEQKGLAAYSRSDYPFLLPEESLLRSQVPAAPVRGVRPRILFLGGYVTGARPSLAILPDRERHCRVVLYDAENSKPLHAEELFGGEEPKVISLPATLALVPLGRYGLELWSSDGQRLDHREFQLASAEMTRATQEHIQEINSWFKSSDALRRASIGNVYFHAGFYEAAADHYRMIPAAERPAVIARILERFGR
jgi:tetratricopeptide (TPR) repeat protein